MSYVFGSYDGAAGISAAAMALVATINTAAATAIAFRQLSLAEKYYDMAKEMRDYWKSTFKPCEIQAVSEACDTPLYVPKYDLVAGRSIANVRIQFKKATEQVAMSAQRYCTGLTATLLRDIAVIEAMTAANAANNAFRYEEARKQVFDDRRWSRRHSTLALGRDLNQQAANYMAQAGNMYGAVRDTIAGASNGILGMMGASHYFNSREDPGTISPTSLLGPSAAGSVQQSTTQGATRIGVDQWNNGWSYNYSGLQPSNLTSTQGGPISVYTETGSITPYDTADGDIAPGPPMPNYNR